ncbi:MAG: integrase arm-type DNA-binding domain-containing protein [Gammaproteobacteria bacterium]|nr:integrase arm-type DNA-binding domain-containing protein [Gammaproteobacteria bacterium]
MTADIVKLPSPSRKKKPKAKPLNVLQVKHHKEGTLSDAHPHKGLRVRANKNGTKTWIYRYRAGNKLRQIRLGSYPGMDLAEAREAYIEQRRLREQSQDPRRVAAERKKEAERQEYTFAVMVEQYLTERVEKDRKAKGATETRRLLENDLGKLAKQLTEDVTPSEIHNHILGIADRAPIIALNFRAELARAWRYAANTGRTNCVCPINSDTGGKLQQGKRERHLSQAELRLLLPWMHNYSDTVCDALTLTLYMGLRSGEVCKLRDEWLAEEADGWWITIPASEMKRDHSNHRVPMAGTPLDIVQRRSGKGFWFPSRARPYIQQKVLGVEVYAHSGRSKAKVYQSHIICPVTDWAPNDLRKTARTQLAAMGCPFEVAEAILHHRLPGVGGLYNQHQYDQEKRHWLTRLGELLDGLRSEQQK